jgi:tripartite-type tricarboxylate transporter receptor subunit TctC
MQCMTRISRALVACALAAGLGAAQAQAYPDKPVRFIIPTTAGGTADLIARVMAEGMSRQLNQAIVVENKPGADQAIALEYLARSAPADGYAVGLIGTDSLALLPLLKKELRFNATQDFAPVAGLGEVRYALVGPSTAPTQNFKELIERVKANPGKFNYGSSVLQVRLPSLVLIKALGLDMVHIPFTAAPMLTAVAAGTIDWCIVGEGTGGSLKPRVRFYAITGSERSAANPEVPTFNELGFPRIYGPAYALMVRAGTPQAIVDKLSAAAAVTLAAPETRVAMQRLLLDIKYEPPDVLARTLAERQKAFEEIGRQNDLKPE